jgi:phosphohistidine phosphatase
MTRTLILMRHAKSSWQDPTLPDHDRPLNARGRNSARALGDWLRSANRLPDLTLCSSARRTRETLEGLGLTTEARFLPALYHAGADRMLDILQQADTPLVLMIGHNPGIADFAERLLARLPDHPRFHDYPTGATLIARFDIKDWRDAGWHRAEPEIFTIPRDLIA